MLKVYNTLTRKLEEFVPLEPGKVKMYCCGPTVYDLLHVGNFRGAVFYNFVRNWLKHLGYQVKFVYNYTDVDDKIINKSLIEGLSAKEVAEKYIHEFETDFKRLGLRSHDANPKVTETMPEILEMVQELIEKKKAYVAGGDVNYSIKSFEGYGKLSGRNPDDLLSGVRIDKDEQKQNPLDFALWKSAKPGEPAWTSPWGEGRPGWHIECSAMIRKHLGEAIDIHGGGMDLIFPHHENEVAQSEGCTGKPFVKYWLHNNMLNFGGAKMSKSLGNVRSGRSFMDEYHPEIFKYMMMSVHYRSVSDFSEESIENNIRGLARIYSAMALAESLIESASDSEKIFLKNELEPRTGGESSLSRSDSESFVHDQFAKAKVQISDFQKAIDLAWTQIQESFNDDFGTPEAFARLFEITRQFNQQAKRGMKVNPPILLRSVEYLKFVHRFGDLMALFEMQASQFLNELDNMLLRKANIDRSEVESLVQERLQARAQKDYAKSDEIRNKLTAMGISVSDLQAGSHWEVTK